MQEISRGRIIIGAYETMEQAHKILREAPSGQVFGNSPIVFVTPPSHLGVNVVRIAQAAYQMYGKLATWPLTSTGAEVWGEILVEVESLPDDRHYDVKRNILFVAADPIRANQLLSYFIERREVSPFKLEAGKFHRLHRDPKTTPKDAPIVVRA